MNKLNRIIVITTLLVIKSKMATSNKYCSLQSVTGQSRYFMCGRHEYCCTFGCCVHLAFQFYQLWYYWLLLIFMFMVCSGGSWWYRFCRQNESTGSIRSQIHGSDTGSYYGANHHLLHSTPTRSVNGGSVNGSHRHAAAAAAAAAANDYERRVTLVRNNGVHSYYYRNGRSPSYYDSPSTRYHNGAGGGADRTMRRYQQQQQPHLHQANFLQARPELCPYYQLYGPPPSYESVVQLSSDNATTSCTLADPLTTVATSVANEDDPLQSQVGCTTLVGPVAATIATSSPRIIQPIVTVNLSNALSTSIEVRPICSASSSAAGLSLGEPQPQQPKQPQQSPVGVHTNTNLNHVEIVQQQQQQQPQHIENSAKSSDDSTTSLHEMGMREATVSMGAESAAVDSQQLNDTNSSITTTTTTTIIPLPFRTNFLLKNEKNSIPSVCSSMSSSVAAAAAAAPKYCSGGEQQQQHIFPSQHQHQSHASTILNDFDNTQCTCAMASSLVAMPSASSSSAMASPSLSNHSNKSKFLKSSKFNRKYYKKNSNSSDATPLHICSAGASGGGGSSSCSSSSGSNVNTSSNQNSPNLTNASSSNSRLFSSFKAGPEHTNITSCLNPADCQGVDKATTTASSVGSPLTIANVRTLSRKH